ncbi:unnamed protein product [Cuscuta epithymum]|uniref:Scarecrow-like protein 14 n=1 Tax=Cuscuta epithymum TaxID=186058 RepID=A0AAV0DTT7_9ASTE|nr:unnamed protein product [Cuscuta epithymum]
MDPKFLSSPKSSFSGINNLTVNKSATTEQDETGDYPDATLKYISQMLMEEEDLENQPFMLSECLALQATEKHLSEVLKGTDNQPDGFSWGRHPSNSSSDSLLSPFEGEHGLVSRASGEGVEETEKDLSPSKGKRNHDTPFECEHGLVSRASREGEEETEEGSPSKGKRNHDSPYECQHGLVSRESGGVEETEKDRSPSKGKRNHDSSPGNDSAETHQSNNKYSAPSYSEESEPMDDRYYDSFLCPVDRKIVACPPKNIEKSEPKARRRNRRGKKKQQTEKDYVDFRGLLTQCAQSLIIYDIKAANVTLKTIRLHSSPYGNGIERMSFYLANALEARSNGMGTSLYISKHPDNISAADMVKAFRMYINAIPFKVLSTIMANRCIGKLVAAGRATSLHIIDFGILYGFQWPSLIQGLSTRPGGPPRLRITGIDFPQPGFRPEEQVKATGIRLQKYCKRFHVPFEYKAIATKWERITLEDLDIDRDYDVLVVNCLDRLGTVPDETMVPDSPRDIVLNLIKNINPNLFIHAVVNGTFNAPFFATRFREAVFHFYSLFDMFDVTVPSEDTDRRLFEEMLLAKDVMNVIACEGTERVERPETYKQWQVRSLKAGLQQLPLDQEILKFVTERMKSDFNKNFSLEEDGNWMLQGWKGRVHHALSFWKPINN